MNIEQIYSLFKKHPVIRTDSRKVTISSLFFALSGDNFDGNEFVLDAIENGAAYCIIDNPEYKYDERCILVHNTLKTLQDLAKHHRNHIDIPVIGITGTNGKTTTKELIREVLSEKYRIKATSGNLNNHIGVPLTLLSINKKDEIAIIEMGANHTGEIEFLCDIANPEYGIITNLGIAHLEGFIDFDGVKKTKKELYNHIRKNNGKIILNLDDSDLILMANEISNLSFGEDHNAD
ncbi:MAG: Mur ligase family protein, partial [Bacteroidota bacterium]|nr:Mur ligase family protein [Bacteroidota bacterium]